MDIEMFIFEVLGGAILSGVVMNLPQLKPYSEKIKDATMVILAVACVLLIELLSRYYALTPDSSLGELVGQLVAFLSVHLGSRIAIILGYPKEE